MQVGGREVDAAPVGVGVVVVQPIRARADDAAVDDEGFEIKRAASILLAGLLDLPTRCRQHAAKPVLEVFEDFQLFAVNEASKPSGKRTRN